MIRTSEQTVKAEWLDYNGHMNVAYYTLAFDLIFDAILISHLGMDHDYIETTKMGPFALQSHFQYHSELLEGEAFHGLFRLLDIDHKRIHLYAEMRRSGDDNLCATWEGLSINVDHETRKSVSYPKDIMQKIESLYSQTKNQPTPKAVGQPLRIRR